MKLGRLLWSPVREGETWALTFVRVTGNLLRWIIGLPVVISLIAVTWFLVDRWYEDQPRPMNAMQDVSIGMSMDEVTVKKGAPDRRTEPVIREDGMYWASMEFGSLYILFEGKLESNVAVWRICDVEPSIYRSYNGISRSDDEDAVIEQLGEPDQDIMNQDKLGKRLVFESWNMIVHFEANATSIICLGTR